MRMNRIIAGAVGATMLGLSPVALAPAAGAAPAELAPAAAPASTVERGETPRDLNLKIVKRNGKPVLVGRVTPEGAKEKVIVKRALTKKAPFRKFDVVRANNKGRFTIHLAFPRKTGPVWYYKVTVAGDATYARFEQVFKACRGIC